jgi:hypothetical protein
MAKSLILIDEGFDCFNDYWFVKSTTIGEYHGYIGYFTATYVLYKRPVTLGRPLYQDLDIIHRHLTKKFNKELQ